MLERLRQLILPAAMLVSLPILCAEPLIVPLWPDVGTEADAKDEVITERSKTDHADRSIKNVKRPTLTIYSPPADIATGAAVVICPGGGYGALAIDKEGHDIARWLNTLGVTGAILKYRLPKATGNIADIPMPLQDAQRALRLLRARADEWKIDVKRVGIMGFSAGGHLATTAATHFDAGKADAAEATDRASCRPDFMIAVYPVVSMKEGVGHAGSRGSLLGKSASAELIEKYSNELQVTAQTPPGFLVHAKDDGVKYENSVLFYEALKKAGVAAEIRLYDAGGHGYGLGIHGGEVAQWPLRCAEWLKAQKFLEKR